MAKKECEIVNKHMNQEIRENPNDCVAYGARHCEFGAQQLHMTPTFECGAVGLPTSGI